MLSVAVDEAVQMLQAGWTVRYNQHADVIEWFSPGGQHDHIWWSESLDSPPRSAIQLARKAGHIKERPRSEF